MICSKTICYELCKTQRSLSRNWLATLQASWYHHIRSDGLTFLLFEVRINKKQNDRKHLVLWFLAIFQEISQFFDRKRIAVRRNRTNVTHSLTQLLGQSLSHSLSHSLTHSVTQSATQSLTHSLSLTHTRTHARAHTHTHTHTHTQTLISSIPSPVWSYLPPETPTNSYTESLPSVFIQWL
jgi:hypothetical protein